MAQYEHLPIYKKALDLTVYIENTVRGFSRYHKYTLGADLRSLCRRTLLFIVRANSERDKNSTLINLRNALEELKITMRICKEVKAFSSLKSFTHAIEYAISISRQNEGWIKSQRERK